MKKKYLIIGTVVFCLSLICNLYFMFQQQQTTTSQCDESTSVVVEKTIEVPVDNYQAYQQSMYVANQFLQRFYDYDDAIEHEQNLSSITNVNELVAYRIEQERQISPGGSQHIDISQTTLTIHDQGSVTVYVKVAFYTKDASYLVYDELWVDLILDGNTWTIEAFGVTNE